MAPSALPAPTMVCNSSMKRITLPSCLARSLSTAFKRSSNSPRYLAPAMSAPMSRESTRLLRRESATSPLTIRWARPSTMAVLPTPGSPMSTGLFFVRRCKTCTVRRISSSRPMTGSSLPCVARSVRSMVYFPSASRASSPISLSIVLPSRAASMASPRAAGAMPAVSSRVRMLASSASAASTRSTATKLSPASCASASARERTVANPLDALSCPSPGAPRVGSCAIAALVASRSVAMSPPAR